LGHAILLNIAVEFTAAKLLVDAQNRIADDLFKLPVCHGASNANAHDEDFSLRSELLVWDEKGS
jgi:hypothetical protein